MMPLRLVVMGTSPFAVPALERLAAAGHDIAAVFTQPPRPAGRGMAERRTVMHEAALRLGLEVRTPSSLKDEAVQAAFRDLGTDLAVVGAYGLILPRPILAVPRLGCINLHASLLPRWRGAAPIQRAILAGDEATGITIFQMEPGLDKGPAYAMQSLTIDARETAGELHDRLSILAAEMIPGVVEAIAAGLAPLPQPADGVTYAAKLEKEEGRIDWRRDALELDRQVRALTPWPGSFAMLGQERLAIVRAEPVAGAGEPGTVLEAPLTVACGTGALRIVEAQRAGRRPMAAQELARGLRLAPGDRLG